MVADKLVQLILRVEQKTNFGEMNWEATVDDHTFQASLGIYTIAIAQEPDRDSPEPNYRLSIIDNQGRTVESASNADLSGQQEAFHSHPYVVLQGIYQGARRRALGADQALDILLAQLEGELRIISAKYGAGDRFVDVGPLLASKIRNGRLQMQIDNSTMGGDPVNGLPKQLTVEFSYRGARLSKTVRENDALTLP